MDIQDILDRLEGVRRTGPDKYQSRWPAHHDTDPSFSIAMDGTKILLHCFAGCSKGEVLDALGIKMSDLFLDENYGSACSRKMDTGIDQVQLDKMVVEIAAADLKAGKDLNIYDMARVKLAKRRLSDG